MRTFLLRAYVRYQAKKNRETRYCPSCTGHVRVEHRVSILNILVYLIIAIALGFMTHPLWGLAVFVGCLLVNRRFIRPTCIRCHTQVSVDNSSAQQAASTSFDKIENSEQDTVRPPAE